MSLRPIATAGLLAALTLLLYGFGLGASPLTTEEIAFNTQAQSIRTGSMPLFFHAQGDQWLPPVAVYANAAIRSAAGGEMSGRVASAIAGAADVALAFLIAQLITGRSWVGIVTAVLLAATPAHWRFAQLGTDAIVPVPLILLWLWNVVSFFQRDSIRNLGAAAAALGLSVYAHPAAPLTALYLWALTLYVARRRNRVRLATASLIFIAAWMPAAAWFFLHFDSYAETFGRWVILAPHLRNPIDFWWAFVNPNTLGTRAALYWGFWDPSWMIFGRHGIAPLLWWTLPLIVVGTYRCNQGVERTTGSLLIGAALLIPVAGCGFGAARYIASATAILPLVAIVSGLGAHQLAVFFQRKIQGPAADPETAGGQRFSSPS
jgi:hypothetical protein